MQDKILKHTPQQSGESNCCSAPVVDDYEICSECKEHCERVKEFFIQTKGYMNTMVSHPYNVMQEIGDIKMGYGGMEFKGTETELDAFLETLYKDESSFKVIGVHDAKY